MEKTGNSILYKINYVDFEMVVFGWQRILRYFELGKRKRVIFDYDPAEPKIQISFFASDEKGKLSWETEGFISRYDCERFMLFLGQRLTGAFKVGKKQRIIVEYDPQNEKASISFQNGPVMRSVGSSWISEDIDS